jgi:hypothetical protein
MRSLSLGEPVRLFRKLAKGIEDLGTITRSSALLDICWKGRVRRQKTALGHPNVRPGQHTVTATRYWQSRARFPASYPPVINKETVEAVRLRFEERNRICAGSGREVKAHSLDEDVVAIQFAGRV